MASNNKFYPKIGVLAFHSLWPAYYKAELAIALQLCTKACQVDLIVCDGYLTFCNQNIAHSEQSDSTRNEICTRCVASSIAVSGSLPANLKILSLSNIVYLWNSSKINPNIKYGSFDLESRQREAREQFNYTGITNTLGISPRLAGEYSSFLQSRRIPSIRTQINESFILYKAFQMLFESDYNALVLDHPHRTIIKPITNAALDKGVDVIYFSDLGSNRPSDIFYLGSYPQETIYYDGKYPAPTFPSPNRLPIESWFDIARVEAKIARLIDRLAFKNKSSDLSSHLLHPEITSFRYETRYIEGLLALADGRDIVTVFTSTTAEDLATISYPELDPQDHVLSAAYIYAKKNSDILVVIRDHPNKTRSSKYVEQEISYDKDLSFALRNHGDIDNLVFFPSWSSVESMQLLAVSTITISLFSSIAIEAAVLGVKIITSDRSPCASLADKTIDLNNNIIHSIHEQLSTSLDNLLNCEFNRSGNTNRITDALILASDDYPLLRFSLDDLQIVGTDTSVSELILKYISRNNSFKNQGFCSWVVGQNMIKDQGSRIKDHESDCIDNNCAFFSLPKPLEKLSETLCAPTSVIFEAKHCYKNIAKNALLASTRNLKLRRIGEEISKFVPSDALMQMYPQTASGNSGLAFSRIANMASLFIYAYEQYSELVLGLTKSDYLLFCPGIIFAENQSRIELSFKGNSTNKQSIQSYLVNRVGLSSPEAQYFIVNQLLVYASRKDLEPKDIEMMAAPLFLHTLSPDASHHNSLNIIPLDLPLLLVSRNTV